MAATMASKACRIHIGALDRTTPLKETWRRHTPRALGRRITRNASDAR